GVHAEEKRERVGIRENGRPRAPSPKPAVAPGREDADDPAECRVSLTVHSNRTIAPPARRVIFWKYEKYKWDSMDRSRRLDAPPQRKLRRGSSGGVAGRRFQTSRPDARGAEKRSDHCRAEVDGRSRWPVQSAPLERLLPVA